MIATKKNAVALAVALVTAFVLPAAAQAQTWNLVWSDEANGANNVLPDANKWVYDNPTAGASNAEWQMYCGQTGAGRSGNCANWQQNARYDGAGNLVITALTVNGQWTSARLLTASKFTPTYGKIEARIRLPFAAGLWPAFWLLGNNIGSVGWPACGEQDIMESVPSLGASTTRASLHSSAYSGAASLSADYTFPGGGRVDTAYHTYGMIWSNNQIQYYVDGTTFATFRQSTAPGGVWPFNNPFFMILNLAVGGNWPGPPNASTPNPSRMYVDYVRVYQASTTPTPTPVPGGGISTSTWYRIVNKGNGKCIDARSSATANGTAVQQYTCNGSNAQGWQFGTTSSGYYRLNNRNNSAQVIDVSNVSAADNALLHLWAYGGGNNQQWLPVSEGGGYYHFVSRHSGKCLDVPAGSAADSVQLVQYTCNGSAAQSFSLAPQ